jgi:L,D-transpeptidase ErfK/SrfK
MPRQPVEPRPRCELPAAIPSLRVAAVFSIALSQLAGCALLTKPAEPAGAQPQAVLRPDPSAPRLAPLETRHFDLAAGQELVGQAQVLFTRQENTFSAIAQAYDLGYEELRHANPGVDHWLPGEATPVYLPTEMILPDVPHEGIVINVPAMRLWYFAEEKHPAEATEPLARVTTYPIGVGAEGWATPYGEATVTQKARDPVWYVPASVRKEHAARGENLPSVVPPGPDNPLGRHALALSIPGYLIHGTNKPAGVGMRSSHGCIRLYPQDVEALFERVQRGTKVRLVNQPVVAGWRDGQLYLEVHRPLAEDTLDLAAEVERVLSRAIERAGGAGVAIDRTVVEQVVREQRGIAFPVSSGQRGPEAYLAAARVIENETPIAMAEQTARAESSNAD